MSRTLQRPLVAWGWLRRASQSPAGLLIALLLTATVCIVPSLISGPPVPNVDDEWGYLLSADTFAQGRLTNETPATAAHFETRHQLIEPTRQAKYPPGQGALLAIGQLLGHPILGVWLGCLLMVWACHWMLRAVMPRTWALLGAVLGALYYAGQGMPWGQGMPGYWSQSYWGGALAAAGGALLYGGVFRLRRQPGWPAATLLGCGLALLATTRPKEGLLIALPAAVTLLCWLIRQPGPARRRALVQVVVPITLVLAGLVAFILIYNRAVTGDPFKLPWLLHYQRYVVFPLFIWQDLHTGVTWNNLDIAAFHNGWERSLHERHATLAGALSAIASKLGRFVLFYFGPGLALATVAFPKMLGRTSTRLAALVVFLMFANAAVSFAAFPHYAAPGAALCLLLGVQGLRHMCACKPGLGRRLVILLLALSFAASGWATWTAAHRINDEQKFPRHALQRQLQEQGGQHLVLVKYHGDHCSTGQREWVYNPANMNSAAILWARDLTNNKELLRSYPGRTIWRVDVGAAEPPTLRRIK